MARNETGTIKYEYFMVLCKHLPRTEEYDESVGITGHQAISEERKLPTTPQRSVT
jgi:hypothetical protein